MRTTVGFCAAMALALGLAAGPAAAHVLVFDGFETYGASQTNFNGFNQLEAVNGTVDYVREPDFGLSTPYGAGLVDLDGSSGNGGRLQTKDIFTDRDVIYFDFDARGNGRGGASDSLTFGFDITGGAMPGRMRVFFQDFSFLNLPGPTYTINLAPTQGWTHYRFVVRDMGAGHFDARAFVETSSNDNVGPLIDNFSVTVPEPGTWALMIMGFGFAGGMLRRRVASLA